MCADMCVYGISTDMYIRATRMYPIAVGNFDGIDAAAHPAVRYAHTRAHLRHTKGGGHPFVSPPRYESSLPEQSCVRHRTELDAVRGLDRGRDVQLSLRVEKRLLTGAER